MPVLRQLDTTRQFMRERFRNKMDSEICLCVSPVSFDSADPEKVQSGTLPINTGSAMMASPALVHRTFASIATQTDPSPTNTGSIVNVQRADSPSSSETIESTCMAVRCEEFVDLDLPLDCREVLNKARASSTLKTYSFKWKRFCSWCRLQKIHPFTSAPDKILPYLLSLSKSGLTFASVKLHLAAISTYRRNKGHPSLCSNRLVKQFLKGLFRTFPPLRHPPPEWKLNVVLQQLMKHPFEPIHRSDLKHLSWKTALLLALTSSRRVSEIQAFTIRHPFLKFSNDFVVLRTNPTFIPKVPTSFHLNEPIILRSFFPNPSTIAEKALHTLDVKRCLKFYISRTAAMRKSDQLFISYGGQHPGTAVTKATIARWIASAIQFCHTKSGHPLSVTPRAHSTRAMSSTTALFAGVSLESICRAATWKNVHSFTRHYCLNLATEAESAVGQAVLRNLFK